MDGPATRSLVRSVRFEQTPIVRAVVGVNMGLMGPNGPLPSYFQRFAEAMLTNAYWPGTTSHGDTLIRAAIGGTGMADGWNAKSQRELLTKAAKYPAHQALQQKYRSRRIRLSVLIRFARRHWFGLIA